MNNKHSTWNQQTWTSIKIPESPRSFSNGEEEILSGLQFKTKQLSKASKQANYNVRLTLTLIEMNGGKNASGVSIAFHELAKIFKSVKTAQAILKCLDPILTIINRWDRDKRIAKKYKINDKFKFAAIIDLKKKTISPINTMITNEQEEEEWNTLIEQFEQSQSTEDTSPDSGFDLDLYLKLQQKFNTTFNHNRYLQIGVDPTEQTQCSCCGNEMFNFMFSINPSKELYSKCRYCFEVEEKTGDSNVIEFDFILNKSIKKETSTQRSIRQLKTKI